jgi:hypothetical protein
MRDYVVVTGVGTLLADAQGGTDRRPARALLTRRRHHITTPAQEQIHQTPIGIESLGDRHLWQPDQCLRGDGNVGAVLNSISPRHLSQIGAPQLTESLRLAYLVCHSNCTIQSSQTHVPNLNRDGRPSAVPASAGAGDGQTRRHSWRRQQRLRLRKVRQAGPRFILSQGDGPKKVGGPAPAGRPGPQSARSPCVRPVSRNAQRTPRRP